MDAANRNTALASAFVEELARCGVRRTAISPGSRSTPLALALWRAPEIDATVILDERSAGFFAVGAAQSTGAPVAVLCTSGTAAANLHPAVCEADESGVPLILLTADRPPELRGIGAGQTIDQLKLYGSAVRWFCEVGNHDADDTGLLHYRAIACRACATAGGDPRPGPVHLNFPWREPLGDAHVAGEVTAEGSLAREGRDGRPLTAVTKMGTSPSEFIVSELAGHLENAERPLILAGRQPDAELAGPLARLAQAAGAPVLAEPTSQLRFGPHERSHVVTAYDVIARAEAGALEPDLIFRFGEMPTSKALRGWVAAHEKAPQLVVDHLAGWNEPTRRAAALVRSDPVELAGALAERLGPPEPDWSHRWAEADRAAQDAISEALPADGLSEPAVHRALADAYRDGELVYTASSMPIRDQEAYAIGGPAQVSFLANRGANGIDGLVSSGIGAAVATGRATWVLTGDLGLVHDLNSLGLLSSTNAPVRVVVFDNAGGGIFEALPQAKEIAREEFEALFGTPSGLDCERAASLWGLPHRRLSSPAEVGEAGAEAPGLIEVPVDRARDMALRSSLTEAATDAVARTLGVQRARS